MTDQPKTYQKVIYRVLVVDQNFVHSLTYEFEAARVIARRIRNIQKGMDVPHRARCRYGKVVYYTPQWELDA